MKKAILPAVMTVFALSLANAQEGGSSFGFSKGNVLVEGNLGFRSKTENNSNPKTSETGFEITPRVGYFVSDNIAVGVTLNFASDKTKANNADIDKNSQFAAAAFMRYHFLDLGRFKPYAHLEAGFVSQKLGLAEAKASGFAADLALGVNFFVTEKIAINANLGDVLSFISGKPDKGETNSKFDARLNVFENFFTHPQFGLTFRF